MNFIQCARNSNEQNLRLTQINGNLYFMATRDISIGEELLVWYDEVQYGIYMGLPTGFSETREPIIEKAAMEPGTSSPIAKWRQPSIIVHLSVCLSVHLCICGQRLACVYYCG